MDAKYKVPKLSPTANQKTIDAHRTKMIAALEQATRDAAPKLVKVRRKTVKDDALGDDPAECVVVGKRFATYDIHGFFIGPIYYDIDTVPIRLYDAVQYLLNNKTWMTAFKNRDKPNPISDYDVFVAKRLQEITGQQVTPRGVANWVGEDGVGVGAKRVDKLIQDVLGPTLYRDAEVSARMMNVVYAVLSGQKTAKIGGVYFKNLQKRPDAKYQNTPPVKDE
jgi:hypothetical protein